MYTVLPRSTLIYLHPPAAWDTARCARSATRDAHLQPSFVPTFSSRSQWKSPQNGGPPAPTVLPYRCFTNNTSAICAEYFPPLERTTRRAVHSAFIASTNRV